jgi:hypothetical protein
MALSARVGFAAGESRKRGLRSGSAIRCSQLARGGLGGCCGVGHGHLDLLIRLEPGHVRAWDFADEL